MTTPVKVGINGFGRIGRLVVRALRDRPQMELVHVNELAGGAETAAHLRRAGLEVEEVTGVVYNPVNDAWRLDPKDLDVNYMLLASRSE